jgi:hypothetical protein
LIHIIIFFIRGLWRWWWRFVAENPVLFVARLFPSRTVLYMYAPVNRQKKRTLEEM